MTCGDRVTVVHNPKDELKTGAFKAMLKQPDIDESEFQAMQYTYPVLLSEDKDDGSYVVTCRDIPAVITQGDTFNEALEYAADALDVALRAH